MLRGIGSRGGAGSLPSLLATVVVVVFAGCALSEGAERRVLPGSESSLERLAETAWAALVAGDTATLGRLRLTEREHAERVWPELPASAPELNHPAELAWQNIERRNRVALERLLPRFRGTGYVLESVRCVGEPARFDSFAVRTGCWLNLRSPGGYAEDLQLFKDVVVWSGEHKLFRYYAP